MDPKSILGTRCTDIERILKKWLQSLLLIVRENLESASAARICGLRCATGGSQADFGRAERTSRNPIKGSCYAGYDSWGQVWPRVFSAPRVRPRRSAF